MRFFRRRAEEVPEIDVETVARRLADEGGILIDIREENELAEASIENARHMPLSSFFSYLPEIPKDQDVYMLCRSGQRSEMTTALLRKRGFDRVWNVRGGIVAWARAGLPVIRDELTS